MTSTTLLVLACLTTLPLGAQTKYICADSIEVTVQAAAPAGWSARPATRREALKNAEIFETLQPGEELGPTPTTPLAWLHPDDVKDAKSGIGKATWDLSGYKDVWLRCEYGPQPESAVQTKIRPPAGACSLSYVRKGAHLTNAVMECK
jgi:hypothetical protein